MRMSRFVAGAASFAVGACLLGDWETFREGEGSEDRFGEVVANAGDVNGDGVDEILVGAPGYSGSSSRGKVYLYNGATGNVMILGAWEGENDDDRFGSAIDAMGDVDGDGVLDSVIGAPNYGSGTGKVYLCSGGMNGILWARAGFDTLKGVGRAVASLKGDADGDGIHDVLVSGFKTQATMNHGFVWLLSGKTGHPIWERSERGAGVGYGISLACLGDLDGDALPDVAVGAPYTTGPAGIMSGRVYLYSGRDARCLGVLEGGAAGDLFGMSVGGRADYSPGENGGPDPLWITTEHKYYDPDNDETKQGQAVLLVGAPGRASSTGAVYAFSEAPLSGVPLCLTRMWEGELKSDSFGTAVAFVGDAGTDGFSDMAVGAPNWNGTGRGYLYSGRTGDLVRTKEGRQIGEAFGTVVCGAGDNDGDGSTEILAGAPFGGESEQGRVYIFGWRGYGAAR